MSAALPRFLTLADVAEVLTVSSSQAYALVRNGELRAVKIGGRGQWRVETAELERYIAQAYDDTARFVRDHPYGEPDAHEVGTELNERVRG